MKRSIVICILTVFTVALFAQQSANPIAQDSDQKEYADGTISSLSVRQYGGGMYVNVKVVQDTVKGYFVLERLNDKGQYVGVDIIEVVPTAIPQPILYCLKEEFVPLGDVQYRIKKMSFSSEHAPEISYLGSYEYENSDPELQFADVLR